MDLTFLRNLMNGDERLVSNFVRIFREQAPKQIEEIREALANEDWENFSNLVHSLRTQFAYMGLTDLSEQMKIMEFEVDNGDKAKLKPLLEHFHKEFRLLSEKELQ